MFSVSLVVGSGSEPSKRNLESFVYIHTVLDMSSCVFFQLFSYFTSWWHLRHLTFAINNYNHRVENVYSHRSYSSGNLGSSSSFRFPSRLFVNLSGSKAKRPPLGNLGWNLWFMLNDFETFSNCTALKLWMCSLWQLAKLVNNYPIKTPWECVFW